MKRLAYWQQTGSFLLSMIFSNQRKHLGEWFRSREKDYLQKKPSPWLVFDAIDFLKERLRQNMSIFEYGSGGSTLFWLSFDAMCVSIEHDAQWFDIIRQTLSGVQRVDYRLAQPERISNSPLTARLSDIADPHLYLSADANFEGYTFRNYVTQIDGFPDNYFDVVLVDGRARPSCIMHSAAKVKPQGLLILDNAERSYYTEQTHQFLHNFTKTEFYGVVPVNNTFSRTDIYTRIQ